MPRDCDRMLAVTDAGFSIAPARSDADLRAVKGLLEVYARALGIDVAYQGFAAELAGLPGQYSPPRGELLLARSASGMPFGCVGLRPLEAEGCCEMKRLYVVPEGRGLGLGRALAQAVIAEAERIGYREMRLDSLPQLVEALALYRELGFVPIPPYYAALSETLFFARPLAAGG